jgi:excisionase family DNA binding protein
MKNTYSSASLARMLSVNESTVKRWADSGYIECMKTKGGHRHFSTASVMKFVHENKLVLPELAGGMIENSDIRAHVSVGHIEKLVPELKSAAHRGNEDDVLKVLRTAMAAKPDLLALFEKVVFPPLQEFGEEWSAGKISVDMEHLASQTLRNALTRLQSEIHHDPANGLIALCGCYEGELHDIALLCTSIYLSSRGWKTLFLGQMTPTSSLLKAIRKQRPNLVVLSAVTVKNPNRFLHDVNDVIYPAIHRVGGKFVVGGPNIASRFEKKVKADFLISSITDFERIADRATFVAQKKKAR